MAKGLELMPRTALPPSLTHLPLCLHCTMCGIKNGIKNNKIKHEKSAIIKEKSEETEREIIISHLARNAHKSF